jgi:NTE family protein
VRVLEYVWKEISCDQIYSPNSSNFVSSISSLLLPLLGSKNPEDPVALLNSDPLRALLTRVVNLKRIQRHIDMGLLDAVSVTASNYSSGESVSFFQAMKGLPDWKGPHRKGIRTQLTLEHLMASAAIPVLFPAVQIDTQFFGDGAIRQLAPTSTALHLGARRILAIGVSGNKRAAEEETTTEQPSLSLILGHILNSAFVDTLDNDLEFLRHMNEVLPLVPPKSLKSKNINLKEVDLLEISPSKALNLMAGEYYEALPKDMRRYIREDSAGTLLSLLLFDKGFCGALWQLGYGDAMEQEKRIIEFFAA